MQQLKSFWTLFKLRWKSKTVHLTWYAYLALSICRPAHAVEKVSYQIRYILYVVQNWIMHSCPLLPYSFHQDSQSSLSLTLSGPLFPALSPSSGESFEPKWLYMIKLDIGIELNELELTNVLSIGRTSIRSSLMPLPPNGYSRKIGIRVISAQSYIISQSYDHLKSSIWKLLYENGAFSWRKFFSYVPNPTNISKSNLFLWLYHLPFLIF